MGAWRYEIHLLVFNLDISLVRYRVEHSKINFMSSRGPMYYSLYILLMLFCFVF